MRRKVLDLLVKELERKYPGKWGYAVDVRPVAVVKTVDNDTDALATIVNIRNSLNIRNWTGERCDVVDILKEIGEDWGDGLSRNPRGGRREEHYAEPIFTKKGKTLLGLPIEFCPTCGTERVVSDDRSFCLSCGVYLKLEEGGVKEQ